MRKILLGTTAVVSAAFGAAVITPAAAQDAPTVRLGGSIGVYYGYINQNGASSEAAVAGSGLTANNTIVNGAPGGTNGVPVAGGGTGNFARVGKHDIMTIPSVSVIVSGKSALGFTYGGQVDITFNTLEGNFIGGNRSGVQRSTASADEAYVFVAHPRFGQVRAGDEDGVLGGLMNSGFITNFGTGGVYGVWENFQIRASGNRTQQGPGQLGDNTKVIYMSPQFFGFDFGVSFSPNGGSMGQSGCSTDTATSGCDRAYAFRGATNWAVAPAQSAGAMARRNEYQAALRYRGTFAGVGLAATVGYIGSGVARDLTDGTIGGSRQVRTLNGLNVWQVGAQATYLGVTVGAAYYQGDYNFFWGNSVRGDRTAHTLNVGASYTAGPITVGTNFVTGVYEGLSQSTFNAATGALTRNAAGAASQRRWGMSVGGNYRLAPGLDLVAEYVYHSVREQGRDLDAGRVGVQSRGQSNVFIVGSRLAF